MEIEHEEMEVSLQSESSWAWEASGTAGPVQDCELSILLSVQRH